MCLEWGNVILPNLFVFPPHFCTTLSGLAFCQLMPYQRIIYHHYNGILMMYYINSSLKQQHFGDIWLYQGTGAIMTHYSQIMLTIVNGFQLPKSFNKTFLSERAMLKGLINLENRRKALLECTKSFAYFQHHPKSTI